jgi:hypothetical protein
LIYLKEILVSRQLGQTKLGQPGAPTQDQVNAMVSTFIKERKANPFPDINAKDIDI